MSGTDGAQDNTGGSKMRKLVIAAALIAATAPLGARTIKSVPMLSAPTKVLQGSDFAVKGSGFLPGGSVEVCVESACLTSVADAGGEFVQVRTAAPEAIGPQMVTAIQFLREGGHGRTLAAETVVYIVDGQ